MATAPPRGAIPPGAIWRAPRPSGAPTPDGPGLPRRAMDPPGRIGRPPRGTARGDDPPRPPRSTAREDDPPRPPRGPALPILTRMTSGYAPAADPGRAPGGGPPTRTRRGGS